MSTSATTTATNSSAVAVNTSSSGTSYITGTSTGLNTAAIIQAAVTAKLVPKTEVDAQISTNTNKIAAYQELQTEANALKTASDALKSDTLLGNVFTDRAVAYATSDNSTASTILSASTSTGAQSGDYKVVVQQLAKAQSANSAVQTSASTALGYTGSFTIGEAGKTATTISITPTTTLQNLRNMINTTSSTSGVTADIIQLGTGQYKLILTAADTNESMTVSNVTGDDVLQNLGMTTSSGTFANITQNAQPAIITLNGATVTSDTNTLNNVLTGLSINLANAAPSTTVTINVGNNYTGATTAINDFVTAYNTLQSTIATLKLTNSDGTVGTDAYLYGETTNSSLGTQTAALISSMFGNSTSPYNGLHSLGITLDENNQLVVDSTTLQSALSSNYSDVAAVFASNGTTSTGIADQMSTLVDSYSNIVTGQIASQISNLQAVDVTLTAKSNDLQTQADDYQTQLINTYANLEALYKQADTTKKQILAILTGSASS